jgi:hypothetical protein
MPYIPITSNPYIVGNPIRSPQMFFGREEDFQHIRQILIKETRGIILTLAGERRCGKTSILFQILNGRLGEEFLPFFIDMQAMAAIESTGQFLERIDAIIRSNFMVSFPELDYQTNPFREFQKLIRAVQDQHPDKTIVFLIDEYEIIESKINKGQISQDLIMYFADLMENHNVLYIFTGSNKLEDRNATYWKTLFSKSQYRKITFLKKKDVEALITRPCLGMASYTAVQIDKIYRLTAGQPFYTQIFCQNMIDKLRADSKNEVEDDDIDFVIQEIINNPMPQMIYFWKELSDGSMISLSVLSKLNVDKFKYSSASEIEKYLKEMHLHQASRFYYIRRELEELYHKDILEKQDGKYRFRIDLFRLWIAQEQEIWKVAGDLNIPRDTEVWPGFLSFFGLSKKPSSISELLISVVKITGLLAVITLLTIFILPHVTFGPIASCELSNSETGDTLKLIDAEGQKRYLPFKSTVSKYLFNNIKGDSKKELIVGLNATDSFPAQIIAYSANGKELWKFIKELNYPYLDTEHRTIQPDDSLFISNQDIDTVYRSNELEISDLKLLFIDYDILITATFNDKLYYPSVFVILNKDGAKLKELWHPGHLNNIYYLDNILILMGWNFDLEKNNSGYSNIFFGLNKESCSGFAPRYNSGLINDFKPIFYYTISPAGLKYQNVKVTNDSICLSTDYCRFCVDKYGNINNEAEKEPHIKRVEFYWPSAKVPL